jgi:hypothetical protein
MEVQVVTGDLNCNASDASGNSAEGEQYVPYKAIRDAVMGREVEVLQAVGIDWQGGRDHITCPYPGHGGADDWRWDDKKSRAFCTCIGRQQGERKSHSIFDVVRVKEDCDFDAAKIRIVEIIGRSDLIRLKRSYSRQLQRTDAASLLSVPAENRDDSLPIAYLAHRLGVERAEVPIPCTRMVGIKALGYFGPPVKKGDKPKLVGDFPCAVFETVAVDGRCHAQRIYLALGGGLARHPCPLPRRRQRL